MNIINYTHNWRRWSIKVEAMLHFLLHSPSPINTCWPIATILLLPISVSGCKLKYKTWLWIVLKTPQTFSSIFYSKTIIIIKLLKNLSKLLHVFDRALVWQLNARHHVSNSFFTLSLPAPYNHTGYEYLKKILPIQEITGIKSLLSYKI